MPDDIVVKYVGGGEFISGVPTRDMGKERWERIPEHLRELAMKEKLFELVEKKSKAEENTEEEIEEEIEND